MSGLGGVGKTQIAVEYAYRYRNDYRTILWVGASSPEELLEDFTQLAIVLQLPEQRLPEQKQVIEAVRQWLDTQSDWLLIFDNADDLENIFDYLPREQKGHILLTSRTQAMSGIAQKIEIDPMQSEDGQLLLLRRAGVLSAHAPLQEAAEADRQAAQSIVSLLGGLPLALDQAGAYLEETQESLTNYITLFQQQRAVLLKHRGGRVSLKTTANEKTSSDHLPVATTWAMAFEQIKHTTPTALDFIRLCAFLTPDAIPEELFTRNTAPLDPPLQTAIDNRHTFNTMLAALLNYSLLSRDRTTETLSMHRLIQAVIQDEMAEEQRLHWSQVVITIVSRTFPFDEPAPWRKSQRYILNGLLAIDYIKQWDSTSDEAFELLNNIGTYFLNRGQYSEAEPLFQRALSASEKILGRKHPYTSRIRQNYADLRQKMQSNETTPPTDSESKRP